MKYIKNYSIFESDRTSKVGDTISKKSSKDFNTEESKMSEPNNYDEFEDMFIKSFGVTKEKFNDFLEKKFKSDIDTSVSSTSKPSMKMVKEGAGIGLILFGSVLSFGKVLEFFGQAIAKVVNLAKLLGIIFPGVAGEAWEKTSLEKWGEYYNNFLIKWIFKPIARVLLNSTLPFIWMTEAFIKNKKYDENSDYEPSKNYSFSESDVNDTANAIFYISIGAVLALSIGSLGLALVGLLKGKILLTGALKIATSFTKIWELKCLALAKILKEKFPNHYSKYNTTELSHALTECMERKGKGSSTFKTLMDSIQFNFKNLNKEYKDCIISYIEHHH